MRRYILIIPIAVLLTGLMWAGLWRIIEFAEDAIADEAVLRPEEVERFLPSESPSPSEVLVLLARPLAVIQLQYPPAVEKLLPRFNHEFRARLKVIEILYGDYEQAEIEIESYVHSLPGPGFARHDAVVIYLVRYGDRWIQSKYQYDVAFPTTGGGWALCGPWTFAFAPDDPPLETEFVDFEPPVIFDLSKYDGDYKDEYYSGEYFLRRGSKARCIKGIRISRLKDPIGAVAPTLFQWD